jgi:ATP-dependent helicase/nuclease subunit A
VLEEWDFAADPGRLSHLVRAVVRRSSQPGWTDDLVQLEGELQTLLTAFAGSKPYAELKRAEILAREVPFCIPWGKDGQVMEGVMDLVYRLDGRVWIADYKTDRVEPDELADRAARYGPQAAVYRAAVARCLGLADVGFQFIFLRNGVAVQV